MPKNRLTETLEPQKQKTGAQTLSVAIKPIFSLLYSPTGCSQLALDAGTKWYNTHYVIIATQRC